MVVRAFQAEAHVSEGAEVEEWREQGWDHREGRGQASEGLMCRGGSTSFVPWRSFLSHLCAHGGNGGWVSRHQGLQGQF